MVDLIDPISKEIPRVEGNFHERFITIRNPRLKLDTY